MPGNDQYTKLLLHCDGADGSTSVPDSSASLHAQTAHGSCRLSAAQAKFGSASLKFTSSTSDWLSVSNSDDFNFGSGDFTIDWWAYETESAQPVTHIARERTATYPPFILSYNGTIWMSTGSSWDIAAGKSFGPPVFNAWSHLEIGRQGGVFYAFRDGVLRDSWSSPLAFPANSNPLSIGVCQNGASHMNGYLDEIRISKGICRHTADFTPETEPYSAPPPPPVPLYGQVVASAAASNSPYIDLIDPYPQPCDHYQIEFIHAVSDIETPPNAQAGAVLTAYVSTDGGQSFHAGGYNNTGHSNFPGESNPTYNPQPKGFGTPQSLSLGMRLSVDSGDLPGYGATGIADIFNAGGHTIYTVKGYKGAIGGASNTPRAAGTWPPSQVGSPWFPSDGAQYFHWAVPIDYAGHFDGAEGQRPNAFRLTMNGGGNNTAVIESGIFKLRRMD